MDRHLIRGSQELRQGIVARIERFENIEAWKKARQLTQRVYEITSTGAFARDFGLRDQLRRASVSIVSNIAEGFERDGTTEFRQFLSVAKGSTGEVRAQLYVALDVGLIEQSEFDQLYNLALEVSRMISGFMRYLNTSEYKGNKFK
jgi:four helix bundle protein